jgi:non-ribosomal peptide synthetase component E (peptide arylation enzyme)
MAPYEVQAFLSGREIYLQITWRGLKHMNNIMVSLSNKVLIYVIILQALKLGIRECSFLLMFQPLPRDMAPVFQLALIQ